MPQPTLAVKVISPTVLKQKPVQSAALQITEKIAVESGIVFEINWYRQEAAGHLLVELRTPLNGRYNWFIYASHCEVWADDRKLLPTSPLIGEIKLPVRWDPQTNSRYKHQAARMCFSSSVHMAMSSVSKIFKDRFPTDDDYLQYMLQYGDTTIAEVHLIALNKAGFKAQYRQDGQLKDLVRSLETQLACCIGILHHGTVGSPKGGGHWVTVGGVSTDRKKFQLYDPWGRVTEDPPYSGPVSSGNGYWVDASVLDGRWTVSSQSDGWFMTFYGN